MIRQKEQVTGHLDILIEYKEDEHDGQKLEWQNVLIHGDPEGLRSFAELLIRMADLNQENLHDLPMGAREHIHLQPGFDISKSSVETIVGRIDAKGTGVFYKGYRSKKE